MDIPQMEIVMDDFTVGSSRFHWIWIVQFFQKQPRTNEKKHGTRARKAKPWAMGQTPNPHLDFNLKIAGKWTGCSQKRLRSISGCIIGLDPSTYHTYHSLPSIRLLSHSRCDASD
jgi:hypothetical protein